MPDLLQLPDAAANLQLRRYYDQIEALTDRALNGDIYENEFRQEYERLALAVLLLAFLLAGGNQSSPAAARELETAQRQARESAAKLTSDIYDGRYSANDDTEAGPVQTADEGREKLRNRLVLWTASLGAIYNLGLLHPPPTIAEEPRYRWVRGPTEESCADCSGLDGIVLTASEWAFLGKRPQDYNLECHGFNCLCRLVRTDAPSDGLENVSIYG